MNEEKKKKLEEAGWKVGTVEEFLESDEKEKEEEEKDEPDDQD